MEHRPRGFPGELSAESAASSTNDQRRCCCGVRHLPLPERSFSPRLLSPLWRSLETHLREDGSATGGGVIRGHAEKAFEDHSPAIRSLLLRELGERVEIHRNWEVKYAPFARLENEHAVISDFLGRSSLLTLVAAFRPWAGGCSGRGFEEVLQRHGSSREVRLHELLTPSEIPNPVSSTCTGRTCNLLGASSGRVLRCDVLGRPLPFGCSLKMTSESHVDRVAICNAREGQGRERPVKARQ